MRNKDLYLQNQNEAVKITYAWLAVTAGSPMIVVSPMVSNLSPTNHKEPHKPLTPNLK